MRRIALLADYNPHSETHAATTAALAHSALALDLPVEPAWIATDEIPDDLVEAFDGVWITTGSPYRDMDRALWAIQQARERAIPTLGTCGGFQHMIIELARNRLGVEGATHAEYGPTEAQLFITQLQCNLRGRQMPLTLAPDAQLTRLYGTTEVTERYFCTFGVNPECIDALESAAHIVASDPEGEVRAIELPEHPFFIGTLYVPQALSTPTRPHPLVNGFVEAVWRRS